jgi:hypothetical protein
VLPEITFIGGGLPSGETQGVGAYLGPS